MTDAKNPTSPSTSQHHDVDASSMPTEPNVPAPAADVPAPVADPAAPALPVQFRNAWLNENAGPPQIPAFLALAPPNSRSRLLRSLLRIDIEQRRRRGNPPQREEYLRAFPETARWPDTLWNDLFTPAPASSDNNREITPGFSTVHLDGAGAGSTTTETAGNGDGEAKAKIPAEGDEHAHKSRRFGDYILLELIAEGGMGQVWKAWHVTLDRVVALKMIRFGNFATAEDLRRFEDEARAAARLDHPYIIPVYESGYVERQPYFTMKYIEQGTLRNHRDRLRDPIPRAVQLMANVARAIHHAHERGILHRDLKPSNILVDAADAPYVSDFGLATQLNINHAHFTVSGTVLGTPAYMSPEQASGKIRSLNRASDVYSLGAILYELLTGQPPFEGESFLDTILQVRADPPVPPSHIRNDLPKNLERIILKCLEKNPALRYATAEDLAVSMELWITTGSHSNTNPPETAASASGSVSQRPRSGRKPKTDPGNSGFGIGRISENPSKDDDDDRNNDDAVARITDPFAPEHSERTPLEAVPPHRRLRGHQGIIHDIAVHPKGQTYVTVGADLAVKFWDATTDQWYQTLNTSGSEILSVQFGPSGNWLLMAGRDKTLSVWDTVTYQKMNQFSDHSLMVTSVAACQDGVRWASGGQDRTARLWEWASSASMNTSGGASKAVLAGKPMVLKGHTKAITEIAYQPDGKKLATAGLDRTVRIWDARTGALIITLGGMSEAAMGIAFSNGGAKLAAVGRDGKITVWNTQSYQVSWSKIGHHEDAQCVAFNPHGTRIATAGRDRIIRIWNANQGDLLAAYPGHQSAVNSLAYHPRGDFLISCGQDGCIFQWDLRGDNATVHKVRTLEAHVRRLLQEHGLRTEVCARIQNDPQLDRFERITALTCAERIQDHAHWLNSQAWSLVIPPNAPADHYERALRLAQSACDRAAPTEKDAFQHTLATALFRLGRYQDAKTVLEPLLMRFGNEPHYLVIFALIEHRMQNPKMAHMFITRVTQFTHHLDSEADEDHPEYDLICLIREARGLILNVQG